MFQNGALYDSMSVRQNLTFTLKHHVKCITEDEVEKQVIEALESVGLKDAIDKMPSELSGGMRKRIGLARTLIIKPEIILYDEPTSGLDPITAREISELILFVQKKYQTTSIIITHDLACAKRTGNRIMKKGRNYSNDLKNKFEELQENIAEKYENILTDAKEMISNNVDKHSV